MIGLSSEIPLVSHTDVTSPFPPSGNEGYMRNRDVFCLTRKSQAFLVKLYFGCLQWLSHVVSAVKIWCLVDTLLYHMGPSPASQTMLASNSPFALNNRSLQVLYLYLTRSLFAFSWVVKETCHLTCLPLNLSTRSPIIMGSFLLSGIPLLLSEAQ